MNLSSLLEWNVGRRPHKDAMVYQGRRWSYAELRDEVDALAVGLRSQGIERGEILAILAMNSADYLILALAAARIGAVFLPLNYRLSGPEITYLLDHSGAIALATEEDFAETVAGVLDDLPQVRRVLSLGGEVPRQDAAVRELIAAHAGARAAAVDVAADDLQRVMYTSGTTSRPKGAMLTHGNVAWNMVAQAVELGLAEHERVLNFAPMYHVGGLDIPGFGTWYVGGTMTVLRRFDPRTILEVVDRERITGMVMVATMVHMIRDLPDREDFDTTSVRWLIFSQVPESLYREVQEVFPKAVLIEGYGLTETCNGVAYLDADHATEKLGSAGLPLPHVALRIVDEAGDDVAEGELGEIVVRGPKVSPGYWRDPEATAEAHRDGWFHTGDIGRRDEDGYLFIVDRKKDMIRSGGENVASSEIERVVYEHAAVSEAAVVGVPDDKWGEVPKVFVVPRAGHTVDPDALRRHCREQLAGFKVPKHVAVVDELPRNPSGKVLKRELRDW